LFPLVFISGWVDFRTRRAQQMTIPANSGDDLGRARPPTDSDAIGNIGAPDSSG
jgi:hypothetical protein